MKVLVAGATGALGAPTVRALIANGHTVYGLTRSDSKARIVKQLGATPVIGDALDKGATERAVAEVEPDGIVQLLNAIPKRGVARPTDLDATNTLRIIGTRHLLAAAKAHATKRFVVESMIFGYGYGDQGPEPLDEDTPFGQTVAAKQINPALEALADMEQQVLKAAADGAIEGVVLRFGLFYGPEVGSSQFMAKLLRRRVMFLPGGGKGILSWIHVEDGASACVAALEKAESGSIYNVVDDEPASFGDMTAEMGRQLGLSQPKSIPVALTKPVMGYATAMMNTNLRASNARIKRDLGWSPQFPTYRDGVRDIAERNEAASV